MKIEKFNPVHLKTRRAVLLAALVLLSLSCNLIMKTFERATPTPVASPTPPASPTATVTVTPSATPLSEGLYVPESCQGKPVATISPSEALAGPTPQLEPADPAISTAEQLKVFDAVTSRISKVYLYPDFNGLDWPGLVTKTRLKVKNGLDTAAFYAAMDELIGALKDDHSQFQSPSMVAALDNELAGHNDFVGVGIQFKPMVEKKRLSVLAVFPDSPAEHAGLKTHDSILAVDGLPVVENGQLYFWLVRGPQCSVTVLTVQSPDEEPRQVMLFRSRITTTAAVESQLVKTADGSRIGYIFLPSFFDENIPGQVRKALEDFGDLDGLILDNRENAGGSSDIVVPILSFFAHGNMGSSITRHSNSPLIIKADPIHNSQDVPMVVLVGLDSVSFGEIFSGILQDIGRAKIAGQTTLGNVELLHPYSFEDGSRIWIAEEHFVPAVSHADWEKDGIIPDLQAYADWDTFTFESDPGIAAALELLGVK